MGRYPVRVKYKTLKPKKGKGKKFVPLRYRTGRRTSAGEPAQAGRVRKRTRVRNPKYLSEPAITVVEPTIDEQRYASFTVRRSALERDGYKCRYCGRSVTDETANMDHVTPWKKGGKTTYRNIVTACKPCNKKKGNSHWVPGPIGYEG